jgi:prepilin peptidase CpaA
MTEAAVMIFFPLLMVFAALSDVATMTISNRISIALAIGFVPVALLVGAPLDAIGMHIVCGLGVFVLTFAMFSFGLIGGGDAKLASATALWLGWDVLMNYGLVTAIFGGFLSVGLLAARKLPLPRSLLERKWIARLHNPETGIPYGVALAAGGLVVYPESSVWLHAITA